MTSRVEYQWHSNPALYDFSRMIQIECYLWSPNNTTALLHSMCLCRLLCVGILKKKGGGDIVVLKDITPIFVE